jgi:hypothetical protein
MVESAGTSSKIYIVFLFLLSTRLGTEAFALTLEIGSVLTASSARSGEFGGTARHTFQSRYPCKRPAFVHLRGSSRRWNLVRRPYKENDSHDEAGDESGNNVTRSSTSARAMNLASSLSRSLAFTAAMAFSGAALGPFLDSYHSAFGVLRYDSPITLALWGTHDNPALITSWWVPELFALAGIIIGWLYIILDAILPTSDLEASHACPSAPKILTGISLFTFQYWLSGVMFSSDVPNSTILNVMSVIAALGFVILDGSLSGFISSTATAVGGPLIEVGLLTLSRLGLLGASGYHYTDLSETGFFPVWIAPVYFLGGPAVGNLARGVWAALNPATASQEAPSFVTVITKPPPGCEVCDDTRQVPCPNCDGIGTYVAMGGRSVKCSSCRGRGFVVCRSCFGYYEEDPYDIEAIRDLMAKRPD